MRSVYIIGAAGAGKSTFTAALLDELGARFGPLEDLHALPNKKNLVTLRGHRLEPNDGLYIGCMRDSYPGTDGLDRASSPVGEAWLDGPGWKPRWIVSEGSTLATRRFVGALHRNSRMLLVHLRCPADVQAARFAERGSTQPATFVANTVTRSRNLASDMKEAGATVMGCDTSDPQSWEAAIWLSSAHLLAEQGD